MGNTHTHKKYASFPRSTFKNKHYKNKHYGTKRKYFGKKRRSSGGGGSGKKGKKGSRNISRSRPGSADEYDTEVQRLNTLAKENPDAYCEYTRNTYAEQKAMNNKKNDLCKVQG